MGFLEKIFGTASEREVKRIKPIVDKVEALRSSYEQLTDNELKAKTQEFRDRLKNGETLDDILPEAFAAVSEASVRVLGMRPYRVQVIGGIILHQGRIAEMRTGEGKTLVASMPAYLNALSGNSVHVITVNDYLASRDADEIGKIYKFLGLTVGVLTHDTPMYARKSVYDSDIVYGTNNEFGFDYLRDNMATNRNMMVQRDLSFVIVDEVDSILIDEARTPLIISGPSNDSSELYEKCEKLVSTMSFEKHEEIDSKVSTDNFESDYVIDEKHHSVIITASGYDKITEFFGVNVEDEAANPGLLHHVMQAMRAHGLMEIDKDYIVEDGKIVIVDGFTGRLMRGRTFNNGLHQAIEAKEHLEIGKENVTLASISFQNYFRMYKKLSGMTGTAKTEEDEFKAIYGLDVVEIPTNKPIQRKDYEDLVYVTSDYRDAAVVEKVKECHEKGQPVIVGTNSVDKSEHFSKLLRAAGLEHNVLNAKNHKREAEIIAQAGKFGAITIATNMAGRGTDILLGGNKSAELQNTLDKIIMDEIDQLPKDENGKLLNPMMADKLSKLTPEILKTTDSVDSAILRVKSKFNSKASEIIARIESDKERVLNIGGLYILGTERNESRRIDNQLRGRAGRQGDPGESCFFLSLDDDLLRVFGGDNIKNLGGMTQKVGSEPLTMGMLTKIIESAQKKIEGLHFESRESLIKFDDVTNKQREIIYSQRRDVLMGANVHEQILKMIDTYMERAIPDPSDVMTFIAEDRLLKALFESNYFEPSQPIEDLDKDIFEEGEISPIIEDFKKAARKIYQLKFEDFPEEALYEVERGVLLSSVDKFWREHIDAMEELRRGIGLQGYGQKDPVLEYKFQSSEMFNEMTDDIRDETVRNLLLLRYTVTINKQNIA